MKNDNDNKEGVMVLKEVYSSDPEVSFNSQVCLTGIFFILALTNSVFFHSVVFLFFLITTYLLCFLLAERLANSHLWYYIVFHLCVFVLGSFFFYLTMNQVDGMLAFAGALGLQVVYLPLQVGVIFLWHREFNK